MAVTLRRGLLLAASLAFGARAQPARPANEEPLRALFGLADLQHRASRLAATRDTRAEVKGFAAEMARWRDDQLPRLRTFLESRGIRTPEMLDDQRTVWEALEPLDFLALTRRYAEVQLQALELEIPGYERAVAGTDPPVVALATEILPDLRRFLARARQVHEAVKP